MYSGVEMAMEPQQAEASPADDMAAVAQQFGQLPEDQLIAFLAELDAVIREVHDIGLREIASYINRNGQQQRQSQQQQSAAAPEQQPTGGPQSGRLVMR